MHILALFRRALLRKKSLELFSFIRTHTTPNDVFIFRKPRAFALFTGRRASIYPNADTAVVFCSYIKAIGATYLITAPALDDKHFDDFVGNQFSKESLLSATRTFVYYTLSLLTWNTVVNSRCHSPYRIFGSRPSARPGKNDRLRDVGSRQVESISLEAVQVHKSPNATHARIAVHFKLDPRLS